MIVSPFRKSLVASAGVATLALIADFVSGTTKTVLTAVFAALTASAVYIVPNRSKQNG